MLSGRGTSALSLLVVVASVSGVAIVSSAVSCRTKTTEALDASSDGGGEGGATTADGATATIDGGAVAPDAGGAFASPSIPNLPLATPFTGNYRCFKNGLHLEQTGTIVMSTMHKDTTTDTILVCTAIGDTCTGTLRDIHLVKTKSAKKVDAIRPITLLRTRGGDVLVKVGHEQKPAGAKSTSAPPKAAAGDETFCPRR